jgi:hypothetical protein
MEESGRSTQPYAVALPVHIVAPIDCGFAKRIETIDDKCLPKDHDLTTPNFFGCTTPWLSILTSNTSDANLSSISKGVNCGTEKTHDGKAGAPNQNEGK